LIEQLSGWAGSPSKLLRLGSYKSFNTIADDLTTGEKSNLLALLNNQFNLNGSVVENDEEVGKTACVILTKFKWAEVHNILESILLTHPLESVKTQAVESVATITNTKEVNPQELSAIEQDLNAIIGSKNISET